MSAVEEGERYLPEDVLMEVLARLPVKSIYRFRCVSKYWLHRIPNPNLISSHFHHIINFRLSNFTPTCRILTVEYGSGSKHLKIHTFDDFKQSSLLMTTPSSYFPLVINDGLVLMLDDITNPRDLILVNPTLNKSLLLPPCPVRITCFGVCYAMGFCPSANDFKVFAFRALPSDKDAHFGAVYSVNHGCWTTKDFDFDRNYVMSRKVLLNKGKAHWWSRYLGHWRVVTFDIDSEKFSYSGMPLEYTNRVEGRKIRTVMDLFSLRGSVAIWYSSMLGFYIWVLDQVGDGGDPMWRRLYHGIPSSETTDFFFRIGAKIKFWFDDKCGKFYINAHGDKLLSYDFRRDEIKYLAYSHQDIQLVDSYVESLLLCSQPGMDQHRA